MSKPDGDRVKEHWDRIPDNLDVLIMHGPPYGILDQTTPDGAHLGREDLLEAVTEKRPRIHVFGHIHGGVGLFSNGTTQFVSAAYLNESYGPLDPAGRVRVIDL